MSNVFLEVLESTMAGFWDWDIENNNEYLSPTFKAMFGYEDHEMENKPEAWQAIIFKEDLPQVFLSFEEHVKSNGVVPFFSEVRYHHKNGSTVHVQCKGKVIEWSDDGRPLRAIGSHVDITRLKETEALLLRVTDFLTKTNEAAQVGGWRADLKKRELYWTTETRKIHEVDDDFVPTFEKGLSFFELNDKEKLEEEYVRAVTEQRSHELELLLNTAKGNKKWVRIVATPELVDETCVAIYGSMQDVTKIKNAEIELRLKQEQLSHFVEYSPAAIAMFDNNMCYIAASSSWFSDFRISNNVIGLSHYEVFPEVSDEWKSFHTRCLAGETLSCEGEPFPRSDGSTDWLKWEIRPWFEKPGEIGGIVMLSEVITDQINAKEALLEAKIAAENASKAKTQFLSNMSHEIRTPMNAIIGLTHYLLENARPDQQESLSTLKFSAENLLGLINHILDFSKIEAGKLQLEKSGFSIREVLTNIRKTLAADARAKGIQLNLMLDVDIPEIVIGDATRVGQVFTNLISNAIKFTDAGSVTITGSLIQVKDAIASMDFSVADTGIGIPKESLKHIFESFEQATHQSKKDYGGTGLGLAIVKQLLNLMDAEITVDSEEGVGSKFSIVLALPVCAEKAQRTPTTAEYAAEKSLKGMRILLAEDNEINVMVMSQYFNMWGIVWDHASNGLEVLEYVEQNDYELILMDLRMPEMDGFTATQILKGREEEKYKKLPIVALTASASIADRERAQHLGLQGYITKPFKPAELKQVIADFFTVGNRLLH